MSALSGGRICGAATVGERGQVVIPSDLRRELGIKGGDKLIVFAKHSMVAFIPAEELTQFLNDATAALAKIKK